MKNAEGAKFQPCIGLMLYVIKKENCYLNEFFK